MQKGRYDAIVILAQQQLGRWGLPKDLKKRLDVAAELYHAGTAPRLIVTGRWAIHFDRVGIRPPITESHRMKAHLVRHGVPESAVLMEQRSKDTIGNAYYLKLLLRRHPDVHSFLIVCATPHRARVQFIFERIFGPDYHIDYQTVPVTHFPNSARKERRLLQKATDFLSIVPPGHDEKLRHLLYHSRRYRKLLRGVDEQLSRE